MKKVLFITFDFPPQRTSGVYRITGLAKYLSVFDWQATVLTVERLAGEIEDPQLLARVPSHVEVVRTPYWRIAGWEDTAGRGIRKLGALQAPAHDVRQSPLDRLLRSMGELVRSCLYFPDDTVGWVPFGLEQAIRLHLRERFDVVYTTSPPRSSPVIGMLLKRLLRIPWVAEFRDPWRPVRRPIRRHLERWLQGTMVRSADAVVVHSKGYGAELQQSYGIPGGKLAVVSNGFDEEDFGPGEDGKGVVLPAGVLHMSHFGTIYPSRSGKFFSALAELIQECPEVKKRIRVNIIGFPDDEALRFAGDRDMKDVLQFRPFMPHDGSLRAMAASHCLLLFWGDRDYSRLTVAGKLYEYLRVGRPILALDHGGETAELIEAAKAGRVIPPDDTERIKQALREFLNQDPNEPSGGPARPDFVAQFRYDRLAGRLAGVLDEVSRHDR